MKMTNSSILTRKMIFQSLLISLSINIVFSMPLTKTRYDQSQSGSTNVRADLDNILILFLPSGGVRFLDSEQIGNLVQIIGSRRNALETSTGSGSDPFKAAIEQAAIDKLHSDVDSLNSIIPISKNYNSDSSNNNGNAEKKEIVDEAPDNIKKEEPVTTSSEEVKTEPEIVPDNKKEEVAPLITTEKESPEPQKPVSSPEKMVTEEAKISTSASPEITTSESVITSIPLLKAPEKDKPIKIVPSSDVTGDKKKPLDDLSVKLHQRVIESSTPAKSQVRSSPPAQPTKSSAPTASSPKTPKVLNNEEKQHERQLKALQSGLIHCLPGQRLTENGNCVEIPSVRESRQQKMERLLSLLRFGVQPAASNV